MSGVADVVRFWFICSVIIDVRGWYCVRTNGIQREINQARVISFFYLIRNHRENDLIAPGDREKTAKGSSITSQTQTRVLFRFGVSAFNFIFFLLNFNRKIIATCQHMWITNMMNAFRASNHSPTHTVSTVCFVCNLHHRYQYHWQKGLRGSALRFMNC